MANVSDVLAELKIMGALGGNNASSSSKPAVPKVAVLATPPPPKPSEETPVKVNAILSGFQEQLEQLEESLRSMLEWCEGARSYLAEQDAVTASGDEDSSEEDESDVEEEAEGAGDGDAEEGEDEASTSEVAEAAVPAPPAPKPPALAEAPATADAATASKPKMSLDALKAQFFAPDAFAASRPIGDGTVPRDVAERIAQINKAEEESR